MPSEAVKRYFSDLINTLPCNSINAHSVGGLLNISDIGEPVKQLSEQTPVVIVHNDIRYFLRTSLGNSYFVDDGDSWKEYRMFMVVQFYQGIPRYPSMEELFFAQIPFLAVRISEEKYIDRKYVEVLCAKTSLFLSAEKDLFLEKIVNDLTNPPQPCHT